MQGFRELDGCIFVSRPYRLRVVSRVSTVFFLEEDIALVCTVSVATPVGSKHIGSASEVPIIVRVDGALNGIGSVFTLYDVPIFRMVARRLGSQRHVLVVLVLPVVSEDKQIACRFIAESIAGTRVCNDPIGIFGLLLTTRNIVDIGVDIVIGTQSEPSLEIGV